VVHLAQDVLKVTHLTIYNVIVGVLPESTSKTKKLEIYKVTLIQRSGWRYQSW